MKYINLIALLLLGVFKHLMLWWPWLSILFIISCVAYYIHFVFGIIVFAITIFLYITKLIVDINL